MLFALFNIRLRIQLSLEHAQFVEADTRLSSRAMYWHIGSMGDLGYYSNRNQKIITFLTERGGCESTAETTPFRTFTNAQLPRSGLVEYPRPVLQRLSLREMPTESCPLTLIVKDDCDHDIFSQWNHFDQKRNFGAW